MQLNKQSTNYPNKIHAPGDAQTSAAVTVKRQNNTEQL